MNRSQPPSAWRLFAAYAAISLVPVVMIGLLLADSYAEEAERRGLETARGHSKLLATAVIEPVLQGRSLRLGVSPAERTRLDRAAARTGREGAVLRLRIHDLNGQIVYSSDGSGLANVTDEDAVEAGRTGRSIAELTRLNSDDPDVGPAGDDVVEVYEVLHTRLDGQPIGVLETYLPYAQIRSDMRAGTTRLYRDIAIGLGALYLVLGAISLTTTRRLRRQALENTYLAEHDQLTGLPNRDAFLNHAANLHPRSVDPERGDGVTYGAVAILDLDRFKEINDTLGHANGDELLIALGNRITSVLGPNDVVARLGGDEFGIVLSDVRSDGRAHAMLSVLRAAVSEPIDVTDLPLGVEASIGYALVPDDGTDPQTLLQRADIAMYLAKANGTGIARYAAAHDHFDADRLALVGELQRALTNEELVLHFQPKLDLRDGSTHGAEALLRWNHPRRGLLQPDTFLPVVEYTGLIDPLTDWVLMRTLEQILLWEAQGLELTVSVNVSARNFAQPAFASNVLHAVRSSGIAAERLILEITETALVADVEKTTVALDYLRSAGLQISIDDFGQGQTSLAILSRLPVSELKVDRSFVTSMCVDEVNAAIVRSVVELGHNLGLRVVAEGAEDQETVALLRAIGCDSVQGYTIGRPMAAEEFSAWMRAGSPARG